MAYVYLYVMLANVCVVCRLFSCLGPQACGVCRCYVRAFVSSIVVFICNCTHHIHIPLSQTRLCDATEKLPGVLCAGVPGAGGVDAVFAIVLSPVARMAVERLWSKWHTQEDLPLGTTTAFNNATVCPLLLHAETDPLVAGVRIEKMSF